MDTTATNPAACADKPARKMICQGANLFALMLSGGKPVCPLLSEVIDSDLSAKEFRRNWARLIQKIYEIDPLICRKHVPAKAGMSGRNEGHQCD